MSPLFPRKKTQPTTPDPHTTKTQPADGINSLHRNAVDAGQDNSAASWSEVHIAGGDAVFALEPAPGVAGSDRHQRAPDRQGEAERGLPSGQDQPTEHHAEHPARFAPTVTADAFVNSGVAALDVPALPTDTDTAGTSRRPLSEILYRARSGTKRDIQLTASAEQAERDFIDLAARAAKRSRSAYLMDAALTFAHAYLDHQRPDGIPPLPSPQAVQDLTRLCGQLLREIHRVGVNLNQIARAVNMDTLPDHAEDVLAEVHALARAGRRALEHVVSGCRHGA